MATCEARCVGGTVCGYPVIKGCVPWLRLCVWHWEELEEELRERDEEERRELVLS